MTVIVTDFKGRQLSLLSRVARKTNGTRYVTRKSVAKVIRGKATHTKPTHVGTQARLGWPSRATRTRMKIGCHIFTGKNAQQIFGWALAA